jgi:amino acid permease
MVEAKIRVVEDFKAGITHGVAKIHETVGFGMLGAVVLGPWGRALVDISIAISQLCFATAYLIFCSKNLHNIIYQFGNCDAEYFVSAVSIIWMLVPLLIPTV